MKRIKMLVTVAAVAVTGTAVAILPMTVSNAAAACAPAWSASAVYVNGNAASYAAHNYTAKWWTQNENPATHSGQWDVWADNGACGGGTPPPTTPPPTQPPPTSSAGLRAAPYLYPGWGNPPAPATVMNATGIKWFTMAFVLAGAAALRCGTAKPALTGGVDAARSTPIRAAGGDVVPSFGGYSGNKLGPNCATPRGAGRRVPEGHRRVRAQGDRH